MAARGSRLSLTLFRSLLREAGEFGGPGGVLKITDPVDLQRYMAMSKPYGKVKLSEVEERGSLKWMFPKVQSTPRSSRFTTAEARSVIHEEFARCATLNSSEELDAAINDGFEYLRRLTMLKLHQQCSTETSTDGVRVDCTSVYFPDASEPPELFTFAYRIRVTNEMDAGSIQVVARELKFEGDDGTVVEVPRGSPGVVGQMPVVHAGETFEYHSSVQLPSSRGSMVGALQVMEGDVSRSFPPKVTSNVEEDPESLIDALIGKTSLIGPFDYST